VRRFGSRPPIPEATQEKLAEKTNAILAVQAGVQRSNRAREIFDASRPTVWFAPIIVALRRLTGQGELCMYCSSNEPSQVEHYRPLGVYPQYALKYDNYLWVCDICNRTYKGIKFPPDNHPGEQILNPLDDDVWEHFFIDHHFGRLLARVNAETNEKLPRAASTCEVVGIDRENVQIKRNRRYRNLVRDATSALEGFQHGTLTLDALRQEIARLRSEPFQADVADFFLNGPGRLKEPFKTLLLAAGEAVA
jgi:uncharacterized protein (TIGR02646 family)